LVIGYFGQLN